MKNKQDQALNVQTVVRRYIELVREFLVIAERYSLRGWPDRKIVVSAAHNLQQLFLDRWELRLDHLVKGHDGAEKAWESYSTISSIMKRLGDEWKDIEEDTLKTNAAYTDLLLAIKDTQLAIHPEELDGPLCAVLEDPEFQAARRALGEAVRKLDDQLADRSA